MSDNGKIVYQGLINLINNATNEKLVSPHWATNYHICDIINQHPRDFGGPVIKLLKDKISHYKTLHPKVVLYSLLLLEGLITNCGTTIHRDIDNKHLLRALEKAGRLKYKTTKFIRKYQRSTLAPLNLIHSADLMQGLIEERILKIIQCWGPLHPLDFPGMNEAYKKWKKKGVPFPAPTKEDFVPISPAMRKMALTRSNSRLVIVPRKLRKVLDEIKGSIEMLEEMEQKKEESEHYAMRSGRADQDQFQDILGSTIRTCEKHQEWLTSHLKDPVKFQAIFKEFVGEDFDSIEFESDESNDSDSEDSESKDIFESKKRRAEKREVIEGILLKLIERNERALCFLLSRSQKLSRKAEMNETLSSLHLSSFHSRKNILEKSDHHKKNKIDKGDDNKNEHKGKEENEDDDTSLFPVENFANFSNNQRNGVSSSVKHDLDEIIAERNTQGPIDENMVSKLEGPPIIDAGLGAKQANDKFLDWLLN